VGLVTKYRQKRIKKELQGEQKIIDKEEENVGREAGRLSQIADYKILHRCSALLVSKQEN
jgi:predicted metal-dependent phosphotriesterase family hydrolase